MTPPVLEQKHPCSIDRPPCCRVFSSRDPTITSRARIFLSDMQKRFCTTDECVSAFRNTITTAPIPSATNTKNLGKKKRSNRTAKLKRCKIDACCEQWLSQVETY